jgi:hypothetical protein
MDENLLVIALENTLGVFILVIAYKIYHSNCHTYVKTKFFNLEVSENNSEENSENIPREISLNPQLIIENGSSGR